MPGKTTLMRWAQLLCPQDAVRVDRASEAACSCEPH